MNPHLKILVQLAHVDGETDESELDLIREIGKTHELSDDEIELIIENTDDNETFPSLEAMPLDEKADLILNLVLMMKADGIVHRNEMDFCLKMTHKLGFPDEVLYELVSSMPMTNLSDSDRKRLRDEALKHLHHEA